jgi:threonine dehydratase
MATNPAATTAPVTIDDVRAAHDRIRDAIVRTPTLISRTFSEMTGANVFLKFENLQFTAAYKERGALNTLPARRASSPPRPATMRRVLPTTPTVSVSLRRSSCRAPRRR